MAGSPGAWCINSLEFGRASFMERRCWNAASKRTGSSDSCGSSRAGRAWRFDRQPATPLARLAAGWLDSSMSWSRLASRPSGCGQAPFRRRCAAGCASRAGSPQTATCAWRQRPGASPRTLPRSATFRTWLVLMCPKNWPMPGLVGWRGLSDQARTHCVSCCSSTGSSRASTTSSTLIPGHPTPSWARLLVRPVSLVRMRTSPSSRVRRKPSSTFGLVARHDRWLQRSASTSARRWPGALRLGSCPLGAPNRWCHRCARRSSGT